MDFKVGFKPKLFSTFKNGYNKQTFIQDLLAGIIVGIVALPLAIAFGIASGATPEAGFGSFSSGSAGAAFSSSSERSRARTTLSRSGARIVNATPALSSWSTK